MGRVNRPALSFWRVTLSWLDAGYSVEHLTSLSRSRVLASFEFAAISDELAPSPSEADRAEVTHENESKGTNRLGALLVSPLTLPPNGFLIGHPSWRNEPSHLTAKEGKRIRITNNGGRGHTFTEVAEFGGGFIAQLNIGLTPAPECQPGLVVRLNPGDRTEIIATATNDPLHKFQCCIHPWMRATIRVE